MGFLRDLLKFATTPDPDTQGRHARRGKHSGPRKRDSICDFQWTAFGEVPGHNSHWCHMTPGHRGGHQCGSIGCGISTP